MPALPLTYCQLSVLVCPRPKQEARRVECRGPGDLPSVTASLPSPPTKYHPFPPGPSNRHMFMWAPVFPHGLMPPRGFCFKTPVISSSSPPPGTPLPTHTPSLLTRPLTKPARFEAARNIRPTASRDAHRVHQEREYNNHNLSLAGPPSHSPAPAPKVQAVALLPAVLVTRQEEAPPLAVSCLSQDTSSPSPAHPRLLIGPARHPSGKEIYSWSSNRTE